MCACARGCFDCGNRLPTVTPDPVPLTSLPTRRSSRITDADVTLDGKFDDNIYKGNRWLTIDKNIAGETGKVRVTTAFGEKGLYFAYDVNDSVSVKNAVTRDSFMNSCVEMYLTVNGRQGRNGLSIRN